MASVSKREWLYKGATKSAWVVRYFAGGKHRSRQFDRKKDADAFKRKMEDEIDCGVHIVDRDGVTVRHACDEFLKEQEIRVEDGRISKATLKNLQTSVNKSVIPLLGDKKIHQITCTDCEEYYGKLLRLHGLSPVTAKERLIKLGQIFDFAAAPGRDWVKTNPAAQARKKLRGIASEPIRTFSPDQILVLLKAADVRRRNQHPRTHRLARCFVHLAVFCGLRWGEIAALTLPRVNFEAGLIEVRHSLTMWDEIKGPKTRAGLRDVHMPPHLSKMLSEWIRDDMAPSDRGLLFRAKLSRTDKGPGGFIGASGFFNTYWHPLLKEAGLHEEGGDNFHFHALRHFYSSWIIANGMSVMDAAQAMGHKRFDMTLQVYAHPMIGSAGRKSISTLAASRLLAGLGVNESVLAHDKADQVG
ncbi:tyrosine-type recombinase/integrase [Xanthobacter sp. DSM 24535]|uniref:tyrosine-type recombinase/integrase n=1 Tax=Roseixanthobacter psychrophilus TaxID=3119917 RepID=UPI00372B800B